MSGSQRPAAVWSFSSCVERLVVRRVDLEDLLARGRRLSGSPTCLRQSSATSTVLAIFSAGLLERRGALHLDVDDLGPLLLRRGRWSRARPSPRSRRIDLEQLPPRVGRVVRLRELLAVDLAELAVDLLQLFGVEHRRGAIDHLVERRDELLRVAATAPDRRRSRGAPRGSRSRCRGRAASLRAPRRRAASLPSNRRARRVSTFTRSSSLVGDVELTLEHVGELAPTAAAARRGPRARRAPRDPHRADRARRFQRVDRALRIVRAARRRGARASRGSRPPATSPDAFSSSRS